MYTFPQQQKLFKQLLSNNSSNKQCADCNTIGPTWASLNFGVFLCSNCSGAHRAMGPTITRVKSTKLDQWQKDWMECMQIGNKQLNQYWQAQLGMNKKPRMGANQPQLLKYATEKYVKKRFTKDQNQEDPLKKYKNGTYNKQIIKQAHYINQNKNIQNNKQIITGQQKKVQTNKNSFQKFSFQAKSNVAVQKSNVVKNNINLLQFDFPQQQKLQTQSQIGTNIMNNMNNMNNFNNFNNKNTIKNKQCSQKGNLSHNNNNLNSLHNNEDQFSQYTQHGTSVTNTTNPNDHIGQIITFDQLIQKKSNDSNSSMTIIPTLHHTHSATTMMSYGNHNINMTTNLHNMYNTYQQNNNTLINMNNSHNILNYNQEINNNNKNIGLLSAYPSQGNHSIGHPNNIYDKHGYNSLNNSYNNGVTMNTNNNNQHHSYNTINTNNINYNQYQYHSHNNNNLNNLNNLNNNVTNQINNNYYNKFGINNKHNNENNNSNQINLNTTNNNSNHNNNSNNTNHSWLDSWK